MFFFSNLIVNHITYQSIFNQHYKLSFGFNLRQMISHPAASISSILFFFRFIIKKPLCSFQKVTRCNIFGCLIVLWVQGPSFDFINSALFTGFLIIKINVEASNPCIRRSYRLLFGGQSKPKSPHSHLSPCWRINYTQLGFPQCR